MIYFALTRNIFSADQLFVTLKTPETEQENEKFKDMKLVPASSADFPKDSDKIDDYLYMEAIKESATNGSKSSKEVNLYIARKCSKMYSVRIQTLEKQWAPGASDGT